MTAAEDAAAQTKLLDNVVATANRLVMAEKDKSKITPAYIVEQVQKAAKTFAGDMPFDVGKAVSILIQRFSHWMGKATTLRDNTGHFDWLSAARKKDWHYWHRYRDFQESRLSDKVVDGLDEATDDILGHLEDPRRPDAWDRRGLVVGHVQSGKTSNYTGLICKAADAGYKIIIVLAGMHNNLRSQTQMRLEEGFLGYETTDGRDPGMPIGVAEFGEHLKTNSATTRLENGDFRKAIAKHFHGISPEERPWLFVVKKQKTVLTALLKWIQTRVADTSDAGDGRKLVTKLPLLMIDDEADNASVDTGEQVFNEDGAPDEEHQPKTINSLVRQLLHAFTRKAYVGYTATPFANIFIHHKGETAKEGPDLFPKSFIINLAAPSNYIGPARMFGKMTKEGRKGELPLSRNVQDHYEAKTDAGWMPPKHKKTHIPVCNGQETIPSSLRNAIHSFVLACTVRDLRGQGAEHSSMLIHVTRYVAVQGHVCKQVEETVRRMRQRITRGSDADELLAQMRKIWEEDFVPTRDKVAELSPDEEIPELPEWGEMLGKLPDVLDDIKVRSINGTAKDALDYATPGAVLKVIAIGGDKLARGLTLEGLCVSYFVRTTKMYDTLMQMGRWFGYRPGYLDLCRLYISPDLMEWFGHIADASEELREEFDFMAEAELTPKQYGLKVMSHEVLTVTSPLKMRSSRPLSLTYSGTRSQTILFHRDAQRQKRNLDAAQTLVASLGASWAGILKYARDGNADSWSNACLWKDVDVSRVLEFLDTYATHPGATRVNATVLVDFITKMIGIGQLKQWSVALLGGGDGIGAPHAFPGLPETESFPARKTEDPEPPSQADPDKFAIGVLTDPKDESIDLDDHAWCEALALTRAAWKPDPARGRVEPPSVPSGKGIREARAKLGGEADRGLLLLYPLAPYVGKEKSPDKLIVPGWDKPIMAFAIAFPSSDNAIRVEYKVNPLYWMQEYGPSE
ncbi:Z1 domain-containing protein [Verminephrobacter eiseniae]|uniref:Z1 domain-containing protein n=1 Tax=Verminephrobacter eiseniae TaxID=364317 RepID=UPI0022381931|nr:Z1 domain-containing protein [Verminephrobacter eiseniae]MCW5233414.1 endonuclease [Verminephrobacter eiseniae]MCW5295033.1 endonuclease [Verminephrobacter eiseniae]MCW8186074.1 endonuclease [Verminephrobacter eiseniae]MCW8224918.1 endonuclease [Verminephrobacter eiseniae]MCW8235968.1 endonuclease [Verminephrobacter eiseniae]